MPSNSNIYKIQVKTSGDFHGSIPYVKVGGTYRNVRQVHVKVSGVWRKVYDQITWTYSWVVGDWTACGGVGTYRYRTVTCWRYANGVADVPVTNSLCTSAAPPSSEYCNCNCACACCCD